LLETHLPQDQNHSRGKEKKEGEREEARTALTFTFFSIRYLVLFFTRGGRLLSRKKRKGEKGEGKKGGEVTGACQPSFNTIASCPSGFRKENQWFGSIKGKRKKKDEAVGGHQAPQTILFCAPSAAMKGRPLKTKKKREERRKEGPALGVDRP